MTGVDVVIILCAIAAVALSGWYLIDEITFHYQRRQYRRACEVTGLAEAVGVLPPGFDAERMPWPPADGGAR